MKCKIDNKTHRISLAPNLTHLYSRRKIIWATTISHMSHIIMNFHYGHEVCIALLWCWVFASFLYWFNSHAKFLTKYFVLKWTKCFKKHNITMIQPFTLIMSRSAMHGIVWYVINCFNCGNVYTNGFTNEVKFGIKIILWIFCF